MSTKAKKNCKTTTKCESSCNWTATQIAEFIYEAETPGTKAAATRRMNQYVESRVAAGADRTRVESNIRSLVNRLSS